MSNDDDFWQLISAIKNVSLNESEKNNQIDEIFLELDKEYCAVKNKNIQIRARLEELVEQSILDIIHKEGGLSTLLRLFEERKNLVVKYMMHSESAPKFTKK